MDNLATNNQNINTGVITLKEITNLIDVEHNKAMKVVEKLAQEPSFGLLEKFSTKQKTGFGEKELLTYNLTKKQAIAVGAKLNNSLLMRVVDRLEELEANKNSNNSLELMQQFNETLQRLQNKSLELDITKTKYIESLELTNKLLLGKLDEKETPKKDRYLSEEEKSIIKSKWKQGQSILSIARQIQRSESAVRQTVKRTA